MVVGLNRESLKEDLLEAAKDLRNTEFEPLRISADLTREQRKDEADMVQEAERRNADLSEDDRAKNLVWMAVGRKGEKRLIKEQGEKEKISEEEDYFRAEEEHTNEEDGGLGREEEGDLIREEEQQDATRH